jgi:hypothetical protein
MPVPSKIYYGSTLISDTPLALPQPVQTSTQATVTADASTNTKGAWTQLIASTTAQTDWLYVTCEFTATNGVNTTFLVDIGTGASGSETVRIANAGLGQRLQVTARNMAPILFPIRVPSGTRIAARAQSESASRAGLMQVQTLSGAAPSSMPTTLDTIGADTAASRGTNLPTSNTFVQLTGGSGTTQDYQALVVTHVGPFTSFTADNFTTTVAKGASGSEVTLIEFGASSGSAELVIVPDKGEFTSTYVGHIPAGTRLAVKASIGRTWRDVILYGVPY